MSSLLRDLVGDTGCEGTSGNPISQIIDNTINTSRTQQFAQELSPFEGASGSPLTTTTTGTLSPFKATPTTAVSTSVFEVPSSSVQNSFETVTKLRNRSDILTRQLFPDQNDKFYEEHTAGLLSRLNITNHGGLKNTQMNHSSMFNFGQMSSPSSASSLKGKGKFSIEDDVEYSVDDGEVEENSPEYEDYMNEMNTDVQAAYDKYLQYMKQTLDLDHIQKTTEEYKFSENNPFEGNSPNIYQNGMQLWKQGDLIKAIYAFEAAVKYNKQNADAWRMLGVCHAECDDDYSAISALTNAVNIDPQNLVALLDLGVCYTNELNKMRALVYLKTWLSNHPSYAHLTNQQDKKQDENSLYNYFYFHQEVISLFKSASEQSPDDQDLHTVLGVLYNISHEYDAAIDSFRKALKLNPNDYSLWNKLGATLANSSNSGEAVESYRKALKLKPNFVRAWINLGIAYANQRNHQEAVKHYLRAISMCPHADNVWQYLCIAFQNLGREDLVELTNQKDVNLFRKYFTF